MDGIEKLIFDIISMDFIYLDFYIFVGIFFRCGS